MMAKPFIKWAGGKKRLLSILLSNVPKTFETYYEPFLGGGALYYALRPSKAILSDLNHTLINAYTCLVRKPEELIAKLREHERAHSKEYYLRVRAEQPWEWIERAAQFIYLNRTCFNGLYRVNRSGQFNVPMGDCKNLDIVNEEGLMASREVLKNAGIYTLGYHQIAPDKGDFVYFDPPYDGRYNAYTEHAFATQDQENLAMFCRELNEKGAHWMVSNSDTALIRRIYNGFNFFHTDHAHSINPKSIKKAGEVLIKNY